MPRAVPVTRAELEALQRELTALAELTSSDARVGELEHRLEARLESLERRMARLEDYLGTTTNGGPQ